MKKIIALILAMLMLVSFAACGGDTTDDGSKDANVDTSKKLAPMQAPMQALKQVAKKARLPLLPTLRLALSISTARTIPQVTPLLTTTVSPPL